MKEKMCLVNKNSRSRSKAKSPQFTSPDGDFLRIGELQLKKATE